MILESFSRPKARDFAVPADDVLLHVPGRMTGVFDGASDSLGRRIGNVPIGRLAAAAAAHAAAELPPDAAADWSAEDILNHLSASIGRRVPTPDGQGPASTTAMIAFECGSGVRLVGIGDTGYRINGRDIGLAELAPDRISIPARVALFRHFQERGDALAGCETQARLCIGRGLGHAVAEGLLTAPVADRIRNAALDGVDPRAGDDALSLLNDGLQSQHRFANAPQSPLGYGVLNGERPDMHHGIDAFIPHETLSTIEIFSDGYIALPDNVSVAAWEARHAAIERSDPHKLADAPAVKGSTMTQFFDDRTIAILRLPGQVPAGLS